MRCAICHGSLKNQQAWMSEQEGKVEYLCNACFEHLEEPEYDVIFCQTCHKQLQEGENYMEDSETGATYCLNCAQKLME